MLGTRCSETKFQDIVPILSRLAEKSNVLNRHSACLIKNGKVHAYGVNKYFQIKVHSEKFHIGIHAEMDTLASCSNKYTKGADILIIRLSKAGTLLYSRPCNVCIEKMKQRGIRKAYYSNEQGQIVYEFIDEMPKIHESSGFRLRNRVAI